MGDGKQFVVDWADVTGGRVHVSRVGEAIGEIGDPVSHEGGGGEGEQRGQEVLEPGGAADWLDQEGVDRDRRQCRPGGEVSAGQPARDQEGDEKDRFVRGEPREMEGERSGARREGGGTVQGG